MLCFDSATATTTTATNTVDDDAFTTKPSYDQNAGKDGKVKCFIFMSG